MGAVLENACERAKQFSIGPSSGCSRTCCEREFNTDVLASRARPTLLNHYSVTPVISRPMPFTVALARATSPMISPSSTTMIRSESCMTSSRSSEMSKMAAPFEHCSGDTCARTADCKCFDDAALHGHTCVLRGVRIVAYGSQANTQ